MVPRSFTTKQLVDSDGIPAEPFQNPEKDDVAVLTIMSAIWKISGMAV